MPYPRQIPGEREHSCLLLGSGDPSLLAQKVRGLFFDVLHLQQRVVPAPFQCARHQTLRRVNFLITSLGECRFILGTFEPHLPLARDGPIA
jgi:hypothetical protein